MPCFITHLFSSCLKALLRDRLFLSLLLLGSWSHGSAMVFTMPEKGSDLIGAVQHTQALPGDTFNKIGQRYDVGYFELVEANPGVDPEHIAVGREITIPSEYLLPRNNRKGIVINVAELRLFYFPPHGNWVMTEPVGIGRVGWETPLGKTSIVAMKKNPTWYVPKSIREWRAKDGVILPKVVPPGPENPLGKYALKLGWSGYLIHGTNDISGVGRRASSGCVRMYPEDIEALFKSVKVGTPLTVIDQPYKVGWFHRQMLLEAHVPLQEDRGNYQEADKRFPGVEQVAEATMHRSTKVDWGRVQQVMQRRSGIPTEVGQQRGLHG